MKTAPCPWPNAWPAPPKTPPMRPSTWSISSSNPPSWTQNARNALLDTAHRAYQAASGEPAAARSTYSYTV
jgi:hypothetical protein